MQEPSSLQEALPKTLGDVVNYKETLNLPQTAFKMKASAATREVEIEQYWEENCIYHRMTETRAKNRRFLLHDGPPYLSSDKIHIGTALNKILKDIITRYKSQRGFYAPYVPGYDGHGLPIENAVVKTLKGGRHSISEAELRKRCRAFAMANLKGQESDFRRLGIWGRWEKPYVTIDAAFEAAQIGAFFEMYEKGYIYKGLKPVYWCSHCETALAEAEVEYDDHVSHSIYVKFPVRGVSQSCSPSEGEPKPSPDLSLLKASFVIWTTTPWTLPANLALSVHPDYEYVVLKTGEERLIVAKALAEPFANAVGLTDWSLEEASYTGRQLQQMGLNVRHPFLDRASILLTGEHVTLEAGTGVVHTAPGHGMDDYLVVQRHNQQSADGQTISILSPVDNSGKFTAEAGIPALEGVFYEKGSDIVLDLLREKGALVHSGKFSHSYPHCWRCRKSVIYRATDQWFIDINAFRSKALKAVDTVEWIPERGRNRIYGMVEGRGDWCLSRQRVWGVPIPIFYCANADCRQVLGSHSEIPATIGPALVANQPNIDPQTVQAVSKHLVALFQAHSSDIWWEKSADELLAGLPEDVRTCAACQGHSFEKEMDIMDVWFDSGITHTAVVEARRDELGGLPAELYLEGSDQHRGWFQSSLLTSVMLYDKAPYKSVLTHGFVLDEQGRKMSKSLGNVVDPHSIIRDSGADVLRLWVASVDYTNDVRIGKSTLHQMAEVYKKVRNTVRFILGNLHDFDPQRDRVATDALSQLDRHTLRRLRHIIRNITDAFEKWEFYRYCHEVQYLCMADLSQLYFDVTKDILYCDAVNAPRRRAVQTVLYEILSALLPVLVPVTPHLAEDIWLSLPDHQKMRVNGDAPLSATLLPWPEACLTEEDAGEDTSSLFEQLMLVRNAVNLALEKPRSEGKIGSSLEVSVALQAHTDALRAALAQVDSAELAVLFITSGVSVVSSASEAPDELARLATEDVTVVVNAALDEKCQRCWRYEPSVGRLASHPALCDRCGQAVGATSE